jgi:hypothetical protein
MSSGQHHVSRHEFCASCTCIPPASCTVCSPAGVRQQQVQELHPTIAPRDWRAAIRADSQATSCKALISNKQLHG